MALKYNNQLKISLGRYQAAQLQALSQIHGTSRQDIIRRALEHFAKAENERLMKSNPNGHPLPGF